MDNKLKEKIEHEVLRLNKLFNSGKPLLDLCKVKEPDFVEASAAGSFLQFKLVSPGVNHHMRHFCGLDT